MIERHETGNEDYWNQKNIHTCFTDLLKIFKNNLDQCKLPDFFNPMNNMLGKKDKDVCHRLSEKVGTSLDELLHMTLLE